MEGKKSRKRKAVDSSSEEEEQLPEHDGESDEVEEEDSEEEEEEEQQQGVAGAPGAALLVGQVDGGASNIPQATGYAIQQENERLEEPPFDCSVGPDKPMLELQAGSCLYYQAHIIQESRTEIRVLFPETRNMAERREWVDKRSSRIWRGRMEGRYWRYIKGSDGGWQPKKLGDSNAGSFRRRGSGRSRGSLGGTRSRGTAQSTEGGSGSERLKAAAAALDTAASPKPKALKRVQQTGRVQQRQPQRDAAVEKEASSGSEVEAEGSGGSDAERQSSGAPPASTEQQRRGEQQGPSSGSAANGSEDPLAAWFQQHYELLRAANLLGKGLVPASAETGAPLPNGGMRRRSGQRRPRQPAAQRSREQRQAERQAARERAQASEEESSEEEGPAGGEGVGHRGARGAGRELKRLQMWAWERRGRDGSGSSDEEDEEEDGFGEDGSQDSAGRQAGHNGGPLQTQRARHSESQWEQQQQQQQQVHGRPADKIMDAATGQSGPAQEAQPPEDGAVPAPPLPPGAAASRKVAEPRGAIPTGEAKPARPKQQSAPPQGQQQQQQQQGGGGPPARQPAAAPPKPRPVAKPLAVLEECDVFGKLPVSRQKSGLPPSPQLATAPPGPAAAANAAAKPGAATVGGQLQLPKQPSDLSAKAPLPASPADKPASGAQAQQQPALASGGTPPAAPDKVAAAAGTGAAAAQTTAAAAAGTAVFPADAAPLPVPHKPVLSPVKRKMLEQTGQGPVDAAGGGSTAGLAAPAGPTTNQHGTAQAAAKRHQPAP